MTGIPRDYPAVGGGAADREAVGAPVSGAFTPDPQQLESENGRMRAQIVEAIAILESGTDYERAHVVEILRDGVGP